MIFTLSDHYQKVDSGKTALFIQIYQFRRVYLAKKKQTQDQYAIKVIKKSDLVRKNQQKTAIAERQAMAQAQQPFVCQLYFAFQSVS